MCILCYLEMGPHKHRMVPLVLADFIFRNSDGILAVYLMCDLYGIVSLLWSVYISNSLPQCTGHHIWLAFGLICGDAKTMPGERKDPYFTPKKALQWGHFFLDSSSYHNPHLLTPCVLFRLLHLPHPVPSSSLKNSLRRYIYISEEV